MTRTIPKSSARVKAAVTRKANLIREAMSLRPIEVAFGPNHVRLTVNGLETKNELNSLEHWRKRGRRRKVQRERIDLALTMARGQGMARELPALVALVRLGPGSLDPLCNLPSSLKAAEDSVCEFFEVDDRVGCPIAFRCEQRRRRVPGVEIVLEWGSVKLPCRPGWIRCSAC